MSTVLKRHLTKAPSALSGPYIISIPITTTKSYIYCAHKPAILTTSQAQAFPALVKLETKLVSAATKLWTKISTSENTVNVKITTLVKSLLNGIPYEENCLRSFPSQQAMIRELQSSDDEKSLVVQNQIEALRIDHQKVLRLPFYHASFQEPVDILSQLNSFRKDGASYHRKYAAFCAIGIPITLPLALVPVVPNVPGLYLAYRFYCNIKALLGVKHLDYLLGNGQESSHVSFREFASIDECFGDERVLTKEIIDRLCDKFHLEHLKEDLVKAMEQEKKRSLA